MIIFLSVVIILLLSICVLQYRKEKQRSMNLRYIYDKLNSIITNSTSEKLLVFTDDKNLIPILVSINSLLEKNQKNLADYSSTEISMRKMLSNISHDLKTPLTVVLGYIETLRLDSSISSEERKALLSKVELKALEVLELINKFFDLAKLESGDKEIPLSRVNIKEICSRNLLGFYDLLTSKGFEVSIDIPEGGIFIMGNEEALDRVLNNLISNAIKYGADGKFLGFSLKSDDSYIYIEVWDKGKGIHESNKDKVFERMYTLEDSRNKLYQGSGLGLTITKRLIENMGGEILLSSSPFEKTSFTVKLKRMKY
ncbi:MAG TPA: sensor histidine kinase [Lachnospiraceae bacterium]|nr:sensor histidine kinase [Lachnospiraceae bacterium]